MYARIGLTTEELELLDDAELFRLLKRGHEEALELLLRRHRDALYRFCCHLMNSREDAEDICQETLARAIMRVDSLQTGSAFRNWLFSIARNLSVDSYRSQKRTCQMPDDEAMPLPLYGETPQDRIETSEEHQTVAEALGNLAHSHQRVLVLREVDGLSYAAIAEEMQVSQSAVETLLFRARRRLREEYSKSAVPVVALVSGFKDLAMRLAAPVASGSAIAKVGITAAVVGTGLATSQVTPATPQIPRPAPVRHSVAAAHRPATLLILPAAPSATYSVTKRPAVAGSRGYQPASTYHAPSQTKANRPAQLHTSHGSKQLSISSPTAPQKATLRARSVVPLGAPSGGADSGGTTNAPQQAPPAVEPPQISPPGKVPSVSATATSPQRSVPAPAAQAKAGLQGQGHPNGSSSRGTGSSSRAKPHASKAPTGLPPAVQQPAGSPAQGQTHGSQGKGQGKGQVNRQPAPATPPVATTAAPGMVGYSPLATPTPQPPANGRGNGNGQRVGSGGSKGKGH